MRKKKILVVVGSLNVGGLEKSCVTFLRALPVDKYELDLMLISPTGIFLKQVPEWVHLVEAPFLLSCLSHKPKEWRFYLRHRPALWLKRIIRSWRAKRQSELNACQSVWKQWEADIPVFEKEYDVAIGESQGNCNYFVLEKVCASRKIIWIHNDYDKMDYSSGFDFKYFSKADIIATISPINKGKLQKHFPELASRIWFIENITSVELLGSMAEELVSEEWFTMFDGLKLVSCGRLEPVKAYERVIMAAAILKKERIPFRWLLIGDGSERKRLMRLREETGVDDVLHLTGLRENPFPYIRSADALVGTSLYEGRPLVIDEAKILGTPVITTNYPTATDSVNHEVSGLICDISPEAIAEAIIRLYKNQNLCEQIRQNLHTGKYDNTGEIQKYMKAIDGL